jgi:gamma-glutamyl-gamma-aminobutyrate hydrolase PuuD
MKKILIGFLSLLFSFSIWASCRLPEDSVLQVGCTYHCDFFYRFRLNSVARHLGYRIQIHDLREAANIESALASMDGVLLPGGADIDPKFYLDQITPELRQYTEANLHLVNFSQEGRDRDPFEYGIVKRYSSNSEYENLPMLGICRGMQMMSVAQGIPLFLDIKTEVGIKNRMNRFDRIHFTDDSSNIMTKVHLNSSVRGFKLHHQGIRVDYYLKHQEVWPQVKVTSWSNGGRIAESLEYKHRPALGVQYHPERSLTGAAAPVFRWFLEKSCEYKNLKEEK